MKQILIALLLAFTTSTVINAQKQSSIEKDSTENVKVTLSKKTDTKAELMGCGCLLAFDGHGNQWLHLSSRRIFSSTSVMPVMSAYLTSLG